MAESTIFQSPGVQPQQPQQNGPEKPPPVSPPPIPSNTQPLQQQQPVPLTPAYPPPPGSGGPFGTIIKIVGGIIGLLLVGFLIFYFVFPLFSGKSSGNVTLTYWGLWEDKATMQPLIDDFQKQHPHITISYEKQDGKQYKERLLTRINNGNGPDIFRFHNSWVPQLTTVLAPLPTSVMDKETFAKTFYPVIQQDVIVNGVLYGIPLSVDTLELFTNTESFQAAGIAIPQTWVEFNNAARTLTVKDQSQNGKIIKAGAALGTYDNITHAPDIIAMLMLQNGTNLKKLSTTPQNASDALNFYISFTNDDSRVWDSTLNPSLLAFAQGDLAMYFGYSWDIFTIKSLNPNLSFSVSSVPRLPGESSGKTIASYWIEGVSLKSKYQKEAFLFMQYLSQKETEQKFYTQAAKTRLFGEPYARMDLADSLKNNPLVYPFVFGANNASSSFFAGDTYDTGLNGKVNDYLKSAVTSMLANVSGETAVNTLVQGVDQVLSQYGIQ